MTSYAGDFDADAFILEIQMLRDLITPFMTVGQEIENSEPLDVLNLLYHNELETSFPNVETALRIFLTLPVTVASNERSFSKLKLIKNYFKINYGTGKT